MLATGADMTNTFRSLAKISKEENMTVSDNQILEKIESSCPPLEGVIKKIRAPYEDNERVM